MSEDEVRLLPGGERSVLVELRSLPAVHALAAALLDEPLVEDVVPGERSLLVVGRRGDGPAAELVALVEAALDAGAATAESPSTGRSHVVGVTYDGPDLHAVADRCGIEPAELVRRHMSSSWTVAFLGFSGGFPYLVGGDPSLQLPRRADPRPLVPARSVAIAEHYCGIYPRAGPGGWHILGRCHVDVFDPSAADPARFRPGDSIRFEASP